MSRQELMNKMELKHLYNFRNNYLRPAQEAGFIEMTNPETPTIDTQKYRLTAKGIDLQTALKKK